MSNDMLNDRKFELAGIKWTPLRCWNDFMAFAPEENNFYRPDNWPTTYPCLARRDKVREHSTSKGSYDYRYLYRADIEQLIKDLAALL